MTRPRPGDCGERGPYGYVCTDQVGHRYTHYDAGADSSWPDRWWEHWEVPLRHHPAGCGCPQHAPEAADTG